MASKRQRKAAAKRRATKRKAARRRAAAPPPAAAPQAAPAVQRVQPNLQATSILRGGIAGGPGGGIGFGSLIPGIARAAGGALGALGGGGGPQFTSGVDPEDVQAALGTAQRFGGIASRGRREGASIDGFESRGALTSQQRLKNFGLQLARAAGRSGESAKAFARTFAKRGGKLGRKSAELAPDILARFPGATIKGGRVKLPKRRPTFDSPRGEELQDVFGDINIGVGGGILEQDLPGRFAAEAGEGLDFRSLLRGLLGGELGTAEQTTRDLSPEETRDLEAELELGRQRLARIQRGNLQRVTGQLQGAGFAGSNLAAKALEEGVVRPRLNQELQLEANLAARRQALQQQTLNQKSSRIRNILGAAQLGGPTSLAQLTSGFTSPAAGGQFTAPQAFGAAQQAAGAESQLALQRGGLESQIQLTPTIREVEQPGLFG